MSQRVVLFMWQGLWLPAGPENGRHCMFSSEASARAWIASEWPEDADEYHFRFLPIPEYPPP